MGGGVVDSFRTLRCDITYTYQLFGRGLPQSYQTIID